MNKVQEYYDSIAAGYDHERFDNSYGKFIDTEERIILSEWLNGIKKDAILNYGCGPGRLTDYAETGTDISEGMLQIARKKRPGKNFILLTKNNFPISDASLSAVYSFHVIMHLQPAELSEMTDLIYNKLTENGIFIFDVLSTKRKAAKKGWHANTSYTFSEIRQQIGHKFNILTYRGILFLPIHRIPSAFRNYFLCLDMFLCTTFLKKYASYYCIYAQKK